MFKKALNKLRERLLGPALLKLDEHDENLRDMADANFRTRAMFKQDLKKPIHVLFVCHEPSLWSMFESIYNAMEGDPNFSPLVVALPYKHGTLPDGQYKDAGILEFFEIRKIKAIWGYDKEKNEWLNPASLMPDYVFFQTPYPLYHKKWSVEYVSVLARVCYIPYGSSVSKGEIFDIVHPDNFFRYTSIFFLENLSKKELFKTKLGNKTWFKEEKVIISGYPKLDYLNKNKEYSGKVWKRRIKKNVKRILWTPRFLTSEGTCHFFDYKDYFFEFCKKHPDVDFAFRPHPLCFQNFISTGEMSFDEQIKMKQEYDSSTNMVIDESGSYEDTFMTSDLLISDYSSMMVEYFATGKPIIYTHRKNEFNEYALSLSKGFYWVHNIEELDKTISMLLSGEDSLRKKREELMKTLFYIPQYGASVVIKDHLKLDYGTIASHS